MRILLFILIGFFLAELVGNSPIASTIVVVGTLIAMPVIAFKIYQAVTK